MKLSIVATLYQSAPYIAEFYQRASAAAKQLVGDDYEIVFVNDGSPDNSLDIAVKLTEQDAHIVVVDLSRNFGHHKAMMTGLAQAKGEKIFLIDSDLEEEPELLIKFSQQLENDACDVVYGVQEQRKGRFFEQWTGQVFYYIFRMLTRLELPNNISVVRLMTSRYVKALLLHSETELFMAGLWVITGFKQTPQKIRKHNTSESTYSLGKKISQFVNAIVAFSNIPLMGIFIVGSFIMLLSLITAGYLVINWMIFEQPPSGYTSLMVSVWLLGGLISACIGIVGIYLAKVYSETKSRPYTIVRHIYNKEE